MTISITEVKAKRDIFFTFTAKAIAAKEGTGHIEKVKHSRMNV